MNIRIECIRFSCVPCAKLFCIFGAFSANSSTLIDDTLDSDDAATQILDEEYPNLSENGKQVEKCN